MAYEAEIETLFDTLTDYRCESHADITNLTGWPMWKVGCVLAHIRTPEIAEEYGWTVPHAPRGRGVHLYQVVALDQPVLDPDDRQHVRLGAISTLRIVTSENRNQAHALTLVAYGVNDEIARQLRQCARAQDGAAAMTENVLDRLIGNGV